MLILQLIWTKIWSMWLASVYYLSGTNLKDEKLPLSNQFKTNFFQLLFLGVSSLSPNQNCVALNSQIKIIFSTTTTSPLLHHICP